MKLTYCSDTVRLEMKLQLNEILSTYTHRNRSGYLRSHSAPSSEGLMKCLWCVEECIELYFPSFNLYYIVTLLSPSVSVYAESDAPALVSTNFVCVIIFKYTEFPEQEKECYPSMVTNRTPVLCNIRLNSISRSTGTGNVWKNTTLCSHKHIPTVQLHTMKTHSYQFRSVLVSNLSKPINPAEFRKHFYIYIRHKYPKSLDFYLWSKFKSNFCICFMQCNYACTFAA
jgi:hypothetical protein